MRDSLLPRELRLLDALFRLSKSVLADARTHIAAAADLDLADFLALRAVELGVDSPGGLSDDLGLNPAVISRSLTKLVNAGLLERRIDPADSRRSRIALTEQGSRTNNMIAARVRPGLAERLKSLDPEQAEALIESLEAL